MYYRGIHLLIIPSVKVIKYYQGNMTVGMCMDYMKSEIGISLYQFHSQFLILQRQASPTLRELLLPNLPLPLSFKSPTVTTIGILSHTSIGVPPLTLLDFFFSFLQSVSVVEGKCRWGRKWLTWRLPLSWGRLLSRWCCHGVRGCYHGVRGWCRGAGLRLREGG